MPSTSTSRLEGLTTSVAVKAPVRVVTTVNITLSGEQTINGVAVVAGDRVLVKDQTTASENGIYVAATGTWNRARDFNGSLDAVQGTTVFVINSSAYFRLTTANPITIGTSSITWLFTGPGLVDLDVFKPDDYGAVGDGVTDDYVAWKATVAAVSANGGGTVWLRPGAIYLIDQYIIGGATPNGVLFTDMEFFDCTGLVIEGNGAKIDVKGDFDRGASTTFGLCGMSLLNCQHVEIKNLEIDGNVELMTNSSDSNEATTDGIRLRSCYYVKIDNVHAHHFANDGIGVRAANLDGAPTATVSRYVTVTNSVFEYNARCAIVVIGCRGFSAKNCSFSETAQFTGTYGKSGALGHAPKVGLDIEPTHSLFAGTADSNTGEIMFDNCRFINNSNGDLRASLENTVDTVAFDEITVISSAETGKFSIILSVPRASIRNSYLDLKDNWCSIATKANSGVIFEGNEVRGTARLLYSNTADSLRCDVRDNRFICTATAASTANLVNIDNTSAVFEDNYFFIPKEAYSDAGGTDQHAANVITFTDARRLARNRYETDLPANQGGAATAHFFLTYGGSFSGEVVDERFLGTAAGVADTFRPAATSTHDTTDPYNRNRIDWSHPGFYVGDGGTITQATDKGTGVELNEMCGEITLNAAALAADTTVSFTLTNTQIGANDILTLQHQSGGTLGSYTLNAAAAAGSAVIYVRNITGGSLSEAIVIRFGVVRGATT